MERHDRQDQESESGMTPDTIEATRALSQQPVTKSDVDALKAQRELLREFVKSQLVEADFSERAKKENRYGEGDFGVIPGTKKRCLFKPGAEKFQKLFRLGCRFKLVDKEIDLAANFAMFTYKCEVFHLASGALIAECDASVNSQETKYKERTVWKTVKAKNGKEVRDQVVEPTPVTDILNTLQKMAQKRAMIGATITATGASEYFTQDMLDPEDIAPSGGGEEKPAKASAAKSEPSTEEKAPECCGKAMLVSKFADRELGHKPWYCVQCRAKKPRQGAA